MVEIGHGKLLYSLYYEQRQTPASVDLAFDDELLADVEAKWKAIVGIGEMHALYMQFEERTGMSDEVDDNDEGY